MARRVRDRFPGTVTRLSPRPSELFSPGLFIQGGSEAQQQLKPPWRTCLQTRFRKSLGGLWRMSSRSVTAAEQIDTKITYLYNLRDGLDSKRLCGKMRFSLELTVHVIDQSLSIPAFYVR